MISYGAMKHVFSVFREEYNIAFMRPNNIILFDTDKVRLVDLYMEDGFIFVFIDLA